jgi:Mn2+/Fe2+ NRAMP family transporter
LSLPPERRRGRLLAVFGPGLLVAATGVGAGDLATASIAGSKLGAAILWAVVLGAALKYLLNEGLARWQLATGQTLLEGVVRHLGRPASFLFLGYLILWSVAVARALAAACGVTAHALLPVFDNAVTGKLVFGALHGVIGVALVLAGGFRLVERALTAFITLMFATVVVTAALLRPDLGAIARGLLVPTVPHAGGEGLTWTVALLGGVGGTVTLLCYGYWIREVGRDRPEDLSRCRLDLAMAYAATALFGLSMVIVGSTVQVEGGGATLLVHLADRLGVTLGPLGRWLFLIGAWGAVASSLLGVWQSVPYLFADLIRLMRRGRGAQAIDVRSPVYRLALTGFGVVSVVGIFSPFVSIQKVYAVLGALFIPLLALALLLLNGRARWIGAQHRNGLLTTTALAATLALFAFFAAYQLGWIAFDLHS